MTEIHITDDCIIYNDMERGWARGRGQPKWHESLYSRWKSMWHRCKNPSNKDYENYKDCEIDERYRLLSNYINDIMQLENFDLLCEDSSKWHIDKDRIDPNNRKYFFEHLCIVYYKDNLEERNARRGTPTLPKPVIGISKEDGSIIYYKAISYTIDKFDPNEVYRCCKKKKGHKSHRGYMWFYL